MQMKRIAEIQNVLNVPKTEKGQNYQYRTLDKTLKALLPQLTQRGLSMTLPVEFQPAPTGAQYVVARCVVRDIETGEVVAETSYPTQDYNPMIKGGQGTGAACTYAKKGAIDSLFLLDVNDPNALDLDDHDGLAKQAAKDTQADTLKPAATPTGKELGRTVLADVNWLAWAAKAKKSNVSLMTALERQGYWMTTDNLRAFSDAVDDYMANNGMK